MKKLVSLTLLFTLFWANAESQFGVLRDGAVHHESVASAAVHHEALHLGGDHGHERISSPTDSNDTSGHSHGSSTDHCTHHHDTGVLTSPAWNAGGVRFVLVLSSEPVLPIGQPLQVPTAPPRA